MKTFLKNIVSKILIWESKIALKKYKPKIVAVTGSVGKTVTKDTIYTLISNFEYTRKSEKSFNSELGVPLTVLGMPNAWSSFVGWMENIGEGLILTLRGKKYPDWLVLEVGVDRPGDIKRFSWLKPDIVVFTRFPKTPVHVEYFKTAEDVINEKRQLKDLLKPEGTLIVNEDDERMRNEEVKEGQSKISYGFSENATLQGRDYEVVYKDEVPVGISFGVKFQDKDIEVRLKGVIGRHHVYPALAALAVLVSEGKTFSDASSLFKKHLPAPGRMRLLHGINGSVIIDDTYNSSPVAVRAGLETLATLQTKGKKIVVLGDMLELGDFSVKEHMEIGREVSSVADIFVSVGVRMLKAAEVVMSESAKCMTVKSFKTSEEAKEFLRKIIKEGDVVFVKGSQGMRMERIVENILHEPNEAVKVLARQDPHWKEKE